MKRFFTASLYILLTSVSASGFAENLDLEPCINGEVSSTGLFATQALEDKAIALAEEPCIHGSLAQSDRSRFEKLKDLSEFARLAKEN